MMLLITGGSWIETIPQASSRWPDGASYVCFPGVDGDPHRHRQVTIVRAFKQALLLRGRRQ
jgi:hypothetical protein